MGDTELEISTRAYCKMLMHAAKYPSSSINGVLLSKVTVGVMWDCWEFRGGAAKFGSISITYHKYIFGVYKYILRLEISIFDRENNKNRQELRIIRCFRDIQSGRGTTINVGY